MDVRGFEPLTPCLQTGGRQGKENSKSLFGLRLAPQSTRTNSFNCSQVAPSSVQSESADAVTPYALAERYELTASVQKALPPLSCMVYILAVRRTQSEHVMGWI